jgi:hypothetical protein
LKNWSCGVAISIDDHDNACGASTEARKSVDSGPRGVAEGELEKLVVWRRHQYG